MLTTADLLVLTLQELSVTDDTVLEVHNEDPSMVQMKLIGDGGRYTKVTAPA